MKAWSVKWANVTFHQAREYRVNCDIRREEERRARKYGHCAEYPRRHRAGVHFLCHSASLTLDYTSLL